MKSHKFKVGQRVLVGGRAASNYGTGYYTILRQLPFSESEGQRQYHVRSATGGLERVIKESDVVE